MANEVWYRTITYCNEEKTVNFQKWIYKKQSNDICFKSSSDFKSCYKANGTQTLWSYHNIYTVDVNMVANIPKYIIENTTDYSGGF